MALPVNGSTHLIPALLLIYRPRKNERLSWPSVAIAYGKNEFLNGWSERVLLRTVSGSQSASQSIITLRSGECVTVRQTA